MLASHDWFSTIERVAFTFLNVPCSHFFYLILPPLWDIFLGLGYFLFEHKWTSSLSQRWNGLQIVMDTRHFPAIWKIIVLDYFKKAFIFWGKYRDHSNPFIRSGLTCFTCSDKWRVLEIMNREAEIKLAPIMRINSNWYWWSINVMASIKLMSYRRRERQTGECEGVTKVYISIWRALYAPLFRPPPWLWSILHHLSQPVPRDGLSRHQGAAWKAPSTAVLVVAV